jgi:hypothetical protein
MDLLAVLNDLRPGNTIGFKEGCEETLSNVVWMSQTTHDGTPFTAPTQEECENHWNTTLKNKRTMHSLRTKRDRLIKESDVYSLPDFPHPTPETKQAWLDYRQSLRDLPANTTDPENPVWPEAPTP